MSDSEFKKHVECILSMSTDYLVGRTSRENYLGNMNLILGKMDGNETKVQSVVSGQCSYCGSEVDDSGECRVCHFY